MNRPIRIMAGFCAALFAALLLNATYLQYFKAAALNDRPDNKRVIDAQYSRQRGAILVGGQAVAQSVPVDDQYKYQRTYPDGATYAQVTGFFSYLYGRNGVEQSENTLLSGSDARLTISHLADVLNNKQPQGGSVTLTINPAAQKAAYEGLHALGDNVQGAVVAIEPSTGRILALVSSPTYDPSLLASHDLASVKQNYSLLSTDATQPMLNRATQLRLPPGSTFKLVTAAAALQNGYTPDSLVDGSASLTLPQTTTQLHNDDNESCGAAQVTLTQALVKSCNVAYAGVGLQLGADALIKQAERFGFGQHYLDDLSPQALSVTPEPDQPQTALSAIGQWEVAATPLQMAMVAAGIANYGQVMKPYLVDEERGPDLSVLEKATPQKLPGAPAMTASAATELIGMMVGVVDSGTGTKAKIPGVRVAGKTGTAQSAEGRPPYAWFVSFAPADSAQVAVAVLVQDAGVGSSDAYGGTLAAPIAKRVMQAVLGK